MLEIRSHNNSFSRTSNRIFSSSVNRWPDTLSDEERAIAQLIGKKEMQFLGYHLNTLILNPVKLTKLFISFPMVLYRAMRVGKNFQGAAILYLTRRSKSSI